MSTKGKKIDYLKEDPPIYGQSWACLSFLTPENVKMKSDVRSVKVRGVFGTEDEARNRCEEIRKFDPDFNVYIAPVGKWLAWCDDPEKAKDFNYANDKLNNMMKSYQENQASAKELYETRKNDMIADSITRNNELKKKNKKKKNKKNQINKEVLENIKKKLNDNENQETIEEIDDEKLNDELKKAEDLYNKLLDHDKN